MMIGVTVTERKRRGRQSGKPQTHRVHPQLYIPKLLCSTCLFTNCQSTQSVSSLHHSILLSLKHTCRHIFLSLRLPLLHSPLLPFPTVWIWVDLNYPSSPILCPPASYESHGGQGPRGCQGLLMTPSPVITSG